MGLVSLSAISIPILTEYQSRPYYDMKAGREGKLSFLSAPQDVNIPRDFSFAKFLTEHSLNFNLTI